MSSWQKVIGFVGLFVSTFAFSGMFFWRFGKRGRGGGTAGSFVIGLILIALYQYQLGFFHVLLAAIVAFIIGVPAVYFGEKFMLFVWGPAKRHTGEIVSKDFNETCIDEVCGMLIAVLPIYLFDFGFGKFLILQVFAFCAFRFFDIRKIQLIRKIERSKKISSPVRIMLDDVVAGAMAMLIVVWAIMIIQLF